MFNFFSKIATKKILPFSFLLLILLGITVPQYADAGVWDWTVSWFYTDCETGKTSEQMTPEEKAAYQQCLKGQHSELEAIDSNLGKAEDAIKSLGDVIAIPFAATVLAASTVLVVGSASIAALSAKILDWIISVSANNTICYSCMENPVISTGWPQVRDLANMFIVLGFVIIGIATALRIKEYEAKKLLPKLIIVALLINFSLLICGIFIDGANITAEYFLKSGGFFSRSWSQSLASQLGNIWDAWGTKSYVDAAIKVIEVGAGLTFYNIVAIVVFFLYAFLYLFRILALWILVILSPIAFVSSIFPFTRKIWNFWIDNFLNWCIITIPISFFVWIADKMTSEMSKGNQLSVSAYLVPGVFMILGFLFSLKISAMGASSAIGAAKWSGGRAWGGTKAVGGGLDRLTGNRASAAAQNVKSGVGRAMERIGLKQTGTTADANNKQVDAAAKLVSTEYEGAKARGDMATVNRIRTDAKNSRGARGAAAMKAVTDGKDLRETFKDSNGNFDANAANARIAYAESAGAKDIKKDATKLNPDMATANPKHIEDARYREDTNSFNQGKNVAKESKTPEYNQRVQEGADKIARIEAFKKATVPDIRNYNKDVLSSREFFDNVQARKMDKSAQEMSSEGVDAIRTHIPYAQQEMKNCYLPGSNILDPAKSERYNELKEKLKIMTTMK